MKNCKVETVEEYLARGGQIEKLPYIPPQDKKDYIKVTASLNINLMSLDEGQHFFSEKTIRKRKVKEVKIDTSLIPASLLAKLGLKE